MLNSVASQSIDPKLTSMFLAGAMRTWFEGKHQRAVDVLPWDDAEEGHHYPIEDAFDVLMEAFPNVNLSLVAAVAYELEAVDCWVSNHWIDHLYFESVGNIDSGDSA